MHGGKAVIRNSQNVKPFNMGVQLVNWTGRQSERRTEVMILSYPVLCMVSRSSGGHPGKMRAKEPPMMLWESMKNPKKAVPRAGE